MSTTIYYFTGTGNSLKIAKDLKRELGNTEIIQICKEHIGTSKDENDKVGFVFPVYARGLPHMVRAFVENLKISKRAYIFAVANYANYPALSLSQFNEIIVAKGLKLSAAFGISMPGNMWFMYYPHPKKDFIDRINAQQETTADIARQIKNKTKTAIFDVVENRVTEEERYRNFAPSERDEGFWVDSKCNGCGICSNICPADNILIVDNRPIWQHHCEFCLACIHWCPQKAIEYEKDSVGKERYHHPDIKVKELFKKGV